MRPPRASILCWASRKGVHWAAAPVRNIGLSPASARRRQSAKASAPCCPERTYWREKGYVCQEKRQGRERRRDCPGSPPRRRPIRDRKSDVERKREPVRVGRAGR